MSGADEEQRAAERVHRLVEDLLAGRRLHLGPADAAERAAIQLAARLVGARQGYPRMAAAFRRRLARLVIAGEPGRLTRRAALAGGLGVFVGAALAAAADRLGGLVGWTAPYRPAALGAQPAIEPLPAVARWWDTGLRLEDLVEGVPRRVNAGSVGAFVVRRGAEVTALSAYCTHLPCELSWLPARGTLNCPCHDRDFDLEGYSTSRQYPLPPLPLVRVRVRQGRVEVLGTS